MPPRYAYWTILVDNQATAFRAGSQEDLLPTFKRLQAKNPTAKMMWFQGGKLWNSRIEAQEAMRERGERGRMGDSRQGGFRDRQRERRLDWQPKNPAPQARRPASSQNLDWKPKGTFTPAPPRDRERKPEWNRKPHAGSRTPEAARRAKLEWSPKSEGAREGKPTAGCEKRKWIPKAEYQRSQGHQAKRDKNWRPGGEHKDPRQKYKDAKKAKWTRFKQNVRARWDSKQQKKKSDE